MADNNNFEDSFRAVLGKIGPHSGTRNVPQEFIKSWDGFVKECEAGYQWTIYEYYDEITIREIIERILIAPPLQSFVEFIEFSKAIHEIDERFRQLQVIGQATVHQKYWWEHIILKRAGPEYAEEINGRYGINIEVIP
jgi:hypothetical protein